MRRWIVWAALAAAAAAAESPSGTLPLANGALTAIYDVREGAVTGFFTHMYKKFAPDEVTPDLCERAAILPLVSGSVQYENGTGILRQEGLGGERYFFAPLPSARDGYPDRALILLSHVSQGPCEFELNFHVGAGGRPDPRDPSDDVDHEWRGSKGERVVRVDDHWEESAPEQPHRLCYYPLGQLQGSVRQGKLQFSAARPGWYGVIVAEGPVDLSVRDPQALLERERRQWQAYHAVEPALEGVPPEQQALYRQSTAFLKMGQVRERDRPASEGQILASLKDRWARCWVRDASYATVALARSGHLEEAKASLDFLLRTRHEQEHDYLSMINAVLPPDRQLKDYLLSVCRMWGNGMEESDWNPRGPNIEFDNWGLFLWAFAEVSQRAPEWGAERLSRVRRGVVEPLKRLIEPNGLILADSSIWEHHWKLPFEYDGRRQYAYTSIAAAHGLQCMGETAAANRIREAVLTRLQHPAGGLASALEEISTGKARDAAVLEAVNWGLTEDPLVVETIWAELPGPAPGTPGLKRNDDGDWYDSQEWLLLDLRGVVALNRIGERRRAEALLDWVTRLGNTHYNGLGELLDTNGVFQGPFPMAGFGPGAYVLAIEEMYRP